MSPKKLCVALLILGLFNSQIKSQAPNPAIDPPNKLCYNYDRAGNRTAQTPAWINPDYNPELPCTPNYPENSYPLFANYYYLPPQSESEIFSPFGPTFWSIYGYVYGPWPHGGFNSDGGSAGLGGGGSQSLAPSPKPSTNIESQVPEIEDNIESSLIYVFVTPNPNNGIFNVIQNGFDKEKSSITITDNKGVILFDREYFNGAVNVSGLSAGSYFLILRDKTIRKTIQFIKY